MNNPDPPPPAPARPPGPLWTLELRWFEDGVLPDAMASWFLAALPSATWQESRTDSYADVDSDALSIKLRGGLLELKGRLERRAALTVATGLVGHPERWVKWSVPGPASPPGAPHHDLWRHQVTKRRAWAGLAAAQVGSGSCFVELTELVLRGRPAWTFAAECAGAQASAQELVAALRLALVQPVPAPLGADRSMGYPAWLLDPGAPAAAPERRGR